MFSAYLPTFREIPYGTLRRYCYDLLHVGTEGAVNRGRDPCQPPVRPVAAGAARATTAIQTLPVATSGGDQRQESRKVRRAYFGDLAVVLLVRRPVQPVQNRRKRPVAVQLRLAKAARRLAIGAALWRVTFTRARPPSLEEVEVGVRRSQLGSCCSVNQLAPKGVNHPSGPPVVSRCLSSSSSKENAHNH
jgi:hypothetical protein